MKKFLWILYSVFRRLFQILYLYFWISVLYEFLKEGDIGGFFLWIAFGGFFFWVVFSLIFKSRRARKGSSRYSSSDSYGGGDYSGSFWDSGSAASDGGGGDGGGGGD